MLEMESCECGATQRREMMNRICHKWRETDYDCVISQHCLSVIPHWVRSADGMWIPVIQLTDPRARDDPERLTMIYSHTMGTNIARQ